MKHFNFFLSIILSLSTVNSVLGQSPTPVLNPIDNTDGDHRYLVSWESIPDAKSYWLAVSNTSQFSNSGVVYIGTKSRINFACQLKGTYFYRFRVKIDTVISEWSNIESVTVSEDPPYYLTITVYADRSWSFKVHGEESGPPWASVSHLRYWDDTWNRGWVTTWSLTEVYWDPNRKYKATGEVWSFYHSDYGTSSEGFFAFTGGYFGSDTARAFDSSIPTSVDLPFEVLPTDFELYQNFPNPFNPVTTIQYKLPKTTHVILIIYNLLGERITTLVNEKQSAGIYSVQWDGKDWLGRNLASGLYLYRLEVDNLKFSKKLTLIR